MSERVRSRERFKLSAAVFLLLQKGDRFLLLLRSNTGWMDGYYSVPSGVKEEGETLEEAVVREAREELSIQVAVEDLTFVHLMHNFTTNQEWLGAFFLTQRWEGEVIVNEPDKHGEFIWVTLAELPPNMSPYVLQALQHCAEGSNHSQFGWDIPDGDDDEIYTDYDFIQSPAKKGGRRGI